MKKGRKIHGKRRKIHRRTFPVLLSQGSRDIHREIQIKKKRSPGRNPWEGRGWDYIQYPRRKSENHEKSENGTNLKKYKTAAVIKLNKVKTNCYSSNL